MLQTEQAKQLINKLINCLQSCATLKKVISLTLKFNTDMLTSYIFAYLNLALFDVNVLFWWSNGSQLLEDE